MKRYIILLVALVPMMTARAQHPAEKYGWGFDNYTTPSFSWDIYRNSYFGIPLDSNQSWMTSPFDKLFYEQAFKTVLPGAGGGGNCFGMGILSLVMNKYGGYMGYCCPTILNRGDTAGGGGPADLALSRVINIMHGHQLSLPSIQTYIDQANSGHSKMCQYGVAIARQTIAQEGPAIISITKDNLPTSGGHTLIVYDVTGVAPNIRLWVIDPNHIWVNPSPFHRGFYTGARNHIDCNTATGHWSYNHEGSIGVWNAGHLVITPTSVAAQTGRTPTSLGLTVGQLIAKVFLTGEVPGAEILQVHNGSGKRLFSSVQTKEVDWSAKTGMRSMIPWFPMDGAGLKHNGELYFNQGALPSADIDFKASPKGVTLVAGDSPAYVKLHSATPDATATMRFSGLGSASPRVTVANAGRPMTVDIELAFAVAPSGTWRYYTLSNVHIPAGKSPGVTLAVDPVNGVSVNGVSSSRAILQYRQTSPEADRMITSPEMTVIPLNGLTLSQDKVERGEAGTGR